jgi:hypothetical protein
MEEKTRRPQWLPPRWFIRIAWTVHRAVDADLRPGRTEVVVLELTRGAEAGATDELSA